MSKKNSDDELNNILDNASFDCDETSTSKGDYIPMGFGVDYWDSEEEEEEIKFGKNCQWHVLEGDKFLAASKTVDLLPPGMYSLLEIPNQGIVFEKRAIKTQGLLTLEGTDSSEVCEEISNFWSKEEVYKKHNLTYKRGILLWGEAGTGKTTTIQLIVEDVVKRGGVCIIFDDPFTFRSGLRLFREVQKDTPVVAIMEDIDSLLEDYSETEVLNILDGLEEVRKIIFLATTNHPEKLGHRICNRPSRFDRRIKIDFPIAKDRKIYIQSLDVEKSLKETQVNKWVKDTEGFTFAHMKELFVSVVILGNDYKKTLGLLNKMKNNPSQESKKSAGFSIE